MTEYGRILRILQVKKTAEMVMTGRVPLIDGCNRMASWARDWIGDKEAIAVFEITKKSKGFIPEPDPNLWSAEFLERNSALAGIFMNEHSASLLALCAAVVRRCRDRLSTCFACGYPSLPKPMYERTNRPSNLPCPSCGFVFGFHDKNGGRAYERWRARWITASAIWYSEGPPPDWNGHAQLRAYLKNRP